MEIYEKHAKFFDRPLHIDKLSHKEAKEIKDDFFFNCPLSTARSTLAKMLNVFITSDHSISNDASERKQIIWFCRELEVLLEVVYQEIKDV